MEQQSRRLNPYQEDRVGPGINVNDVRFFADKTSKDREYVRILQEIEAAAAAAAHAESGTHHVVFVG